ncbi:MAG TPA: hypothetical protein IAC14_07975 [Candidatus Scybalomonas excrementigallinarum]|nr:hypothetical protein [Candidatus Scybalomonas excrementigallinarum]
MAVVISKIRCSNPNLKGGKYKSGKNIGKSKTDSRLANKNYLLYIATRDGVALDVDSKYFESTSLMEHENFDNNSLKVHGAFGNVDTTDLQKLSQRIYNMTDDGKSIFKGIISLTEKDALKLGYDQRESWENLIKKLIPSIAEELNIPPTQAKFVAAVHMEQGHPHLHYMLWCDGNKIINPFIPIKQQNNIRRLITKEINQELRQELALEKNALRDFALEFNKNNLKEITSSLKDYQHLVKTLNPGIAPRIYKQTLDTLSLSLITLKDNLPSQGRVTYKLLSPTLKNEVDQIINFLLTNTELNKEYQKYVKKAVELASIYTNNTEKLNEAKLNAENDFKKRIGNQILSSAKELRKSERTLDYELKKTEHTKRYEEYKYEQLTISISCKLLKNIFSNSHSAQQDIYNELKKHRSKSKQAIKERQKEKG